MLWTLGRLSCLLACATVAVFAAACDDEAAPPARGAGDVSGLTENLATIGQSTQASCAISLKVTGMG